MKTALFALVTLALVSVSWGDQSAPANLIFHPADKSGTIQVSIKHANDPADHVFPKVPLLPECTDQGYFRDPYNCGKFYQCSGRGAVPYALYCSPGFIFNMKDSLCDFPENVEC